MKYITLITALCSFAIGVNAKDLPSLQPIPKIPKFQKLPKVSKIPAIPDIPDVPSFVGEASADNDSLGTLGEMGELGEMGALGQLRKVNPEIADDNKCFYSIGGSGYTAVLYNGLKRWNCETTRSPMGSLLNLKCRRDFNFSRTLTIDTEEGFGFFGSKPCKETDPSFPNFCEMTDAC